MHFADYAVEVWTNWGFHEGHPRVHCMERMLQLAIHCDADPNAMTFHRGVVHYIDRVPSQRLTLAPCTLRGPKVALHEPNVDDSDAESSDGEAAAAPATSGLVEVDRLIFVNTDAPALPLLEPEVPNAPPTNEEEIFFNELFVEPEPFAAPPLTATQRRRRARAARKRRDQGL